MNSLVAVLLLQVAAAAPVARPVVVLVRDASKMPVKGAKVLADSGTAAEKVFAETISKRTGVAKEDGLLDLGLLPVADPLTLRIGAPGFRAGTLKLPANFEAGRRDVVLAPNQDVEVHVAGLAQRKGEGKPEVALARCKIQQRGSSCLPQEAVRRPLDDEGRARFRRLEGGFYNAELRVPGVGSTRETVEVAYDGDAPTIVVELEVSEWTLRGTTRLSDGKPVVASVKATESVRGLGEGVAAETRSAPDGTFEITVVSRGGNGVSLNADSEDPRATGGARRDLGDTEHVLEGVDIRLDATGLEVLVRDSRTNEPLAGCTVGIDLLATSTFGGRYSQIGTDQQGLARSVGLAEGEVRVNVRCEKHYSKDLGRVEVRRDETKRVEIALDPSTDLVLALRDEEGKPVAGAAGLALDAPLGYYTGEGPDATPTRLGLSDESGQLRVAGENFGGKPVFLLAPGRAVALVELPMPSSCEQPADCRVDVLIRRPSAFAGLSIRTESGSPVYRVRLTFRRGNIPVPLLVLNAALALNGLTPVRGGSPLEVSEAAYLPDGTYSVTTWHLATDEATKKNRAVKTSLGSFSVPSLQRVELVDRDGPPQKP